MEIEAVVAVLEQTYAALHPPELSDAASLFDHPIPPRALLDHELRRLNVKSEVFLQCDSNMDNLFGCW